MLERLRPASRQSHRRRRAAGSPGLSTAVSRPCSPQLKSVYVSRLDSYPGFERLAALTVVFGNLGVRITLGRPQLSSLCGIPSMTSDDGVEGVLTDLYPSLLCFAAVVRSAANEPSDLVQEAVLRTLRLHPDLDLDDPGAYLRRAILSVATNRSKAAARRRLITHRLASEIAAPAASFPSDLEDLLRLAPQTRALLFLTIVEGHTHAEAAAIVGCSESAVRSLRLRPAR